jgi:hypothetical protein
VPLGPSAGLVLSSPAAPAVAIVLGLTVLLQQQSQSLCWLRMIRRLAGQLMAAVVDHWLPHLTQAAGVDELQWVAAGRHRDNAGGGQCNTVGGAGDD